MAIPFATDEWVQAFKEAINRDAAYQDAAKNFESDFLFIVEPGGKLEKRVIIYLDLWHGKCRDAYLVTGELAPSAAFTISGRISTWQKIVKKQLDPMQALMTPNQLKLKGNMVLMMKNVKSAKALVEVGTQIDTDFPV